MNEPQLKFTETQTTKFTEVRGTLKDLYRLLQANDKVSETYEKFLYKMGMRIVDSPCLEMRFHVITDGGEHIMFIVKALKVAEEVENTHGPTAESALKDRRSWREFRKSRRRLERKTNLI